MDSRKGSAEGRSDSIEALVHWNHASKSLERLRSIYNNVTQSIGHVNKLISSTQVGNLVGVGEEDHDLGSVKSLHSELHQGISKISSDTRQEISAIDDALKRIEMLLALRKAQEASPAIHPQETQKRYRSVSSSGGSSDIPLKKQRKEQDLPKYKKSTPKSFGTPLAEVKASPMVHRNTGKQALKSKPKKETVSNERALRPGRNVIFKTPKSESKTDEDTFILAIVRQLKNTDGKYGGTYEAQDAERGEDGKLETYDVQDAEQGENGKLGEIYHNISRKSIIPLPEGWPARPARPSSHTTFPVNSVVLALYPNTTCFYRAKVVAGPPQRSDSSSAEYTPTYQLNFDEDDNQILSIPEHWIVRFPEHLI